MGDKPVGRDGSLVDLYPHFQDYYPFSSEPDTSLISQPCVQCDDSNPCTKDTCLADGGCENEPEPQGTPCDDKNACTVNERCNATGQCASNPSESTDAVYRYFNGSTGAYYYSRSDKGGPSGYTLERVVFRIRRQGEPHTVPLYRLGSASAAEFMLSVNPTEASACCGYQQNGVIGGIFPKKQPGAVELHRLVKKVPKLRHVSTLDPQEATTDGYTYQFMQGYVCPPD
jgi:hypothetical protein